MMDKKDNPCANRSAPNHVLSARRRVYFIGESGYLLKDLHFNVYNPLERNTSGFCMYSNVQPDMPLFAASLTLFGSLSGPRIDRSGLGKVLRARLFWPAGCRRPNNQDVA